MILPCFYNPPLSFFAMIACSEEPVSIEQYDHYTKQTYRNRCRIYGANGVIDLVIPVVKEHGKKVRMKDIRIDYDTSWNSIHWKSIVSAYASAPFFEFMADLYQPVYEGSYKFLYDLNSELIRITLNQLNIERKISLSDTFTPLLKENNPAEAIHPKRAYHLKGFEFSPVPYHQVFIDRYGFKQDLSILDLLFNEGPDAQMILKSSLIRL